MVALEHSHHPSEKVRAGSLLLLYLHPEREAFLGRAREALEDRSPLVRIAAAGTLAYRRDPAGSAQLIAGLGHERWEIRWWCAKGLLYLGGEGPHRAISEQHDREQDAWVKSEMADMLGVVSRYQE